MKTKYKNILIIIITIYLLVQILNYKTLIFDTINEGLIIWKNNLIPSLFPFFIISEILINYDLSYYLSKFFSKILYTTFKINSNLTTILFLSILSGFPSNARNTKIMYEKKLITKNEAEKILTFSHFSNPLFILGTLSIMFFNNQKMGIIILISHYLGNFIIGLIYKNYTISNITNINNIKEKKYFTKILINAIKNAINSLLLILGTLVVFLIISTIITHKLNLNIYNEMIIKGLIEITSGLKTLSNINISNIYKTIISSMMLSFGGLCVHMQVITELNETNISYKPYFLSRIIHMCISGIISYILFILLF